MSHEGEVDAAITALVRVLRDALDRGLGTEPACLHTAVFYLNDFGIAGVYVDPPLLAGASEEELGAVVGAHRFGHWLGRDFREQAMWNLEDHPLDRALEPWGDPGNLYDPVVASALYLACAWLEADPALRANVEVRPGFRALFVFHDMEGDVDLPSRALAARYRSGPARAFFDVRGR